MLKHVHVSGVPILLPVVRHLSLSFPTPHCSAHCPRPSLRLQAPNSKGRGPDLPASSGGSPPPGARRIWCAGTKTPDSSQAALRMLPSSSWKHFIPESEDPGKEKEAWLQGRSWFGLQRPVPCQHQVRGPYGLRWGRGSGASTYCGPPFPPLSRTNLLFFPPVRLGFSCDLSQTASFPWLSAAPLRQGLGPGAGFFFVLVEGGKKKKWSHRGLSFGAVWTAALSGLGLFLSFPWPPTPSLK